LGDFNEDIPRLEEVEEEDDDDTNEAAG